MEAEKKPLCAFVSNANMSVASFRYRTASPSWYLSQIGHDTVVSNKAEEKYPVVCFSKHWLYSDYNYARFCKARGQTIVFDICDDHFETRHKDHYHRMLGLADVVTCNSSQMRKVLIEKGVQKAKIRVIPDPVLTQPRAYDPNKQLSLCWYGQGQNLPGLYEVYPEGTDFPLVIAVPGRAQAPDHFNRPWIQWTQWHPDIIQAFGEECSIALLPYRQQKPCKSANRVLEALNVGMPVITDLIPAVKELGEAGIWDLRDGLAAGVAYFSADRSEEMVKAQAKVQEKYSLQAVGKKWEEVLLECV